MDYSLSSVLENYLQISPLPHSLSCPPRTPVTYTLNHPLYPPHFLTSLTHLLLSNLCATCWIISSDPLRFKFFSYDVFTSQNSIIMFCLECAVSLFIVLLFLADICKRVFYSVHIISIIPLWLESDHSGVYGPWGSVSAVFPLLDLTRNASSPVDWSASVECSQLPSSNYLQRFSEARDDDVLL